MIEKIIHFVVPEHISAAQQRLINIAKDLHPGWEVKVWQDPLDPDGFTLGEYHEKANSGAQLADLIRLDVVYQHGGVYLDADMELVRPIDGIRKLNGFVCSTENGQFLTNAFFAAPKQNAALGQIINELRRNEPDWTEPANRTTGPGLFSKVLGNREDVTILPRESFYPYLWNQNPRKPHPNAIGSHHWARSWKPKARYKHIYSVNKRKLLDIARTEGGRMLRAGKRALARMGHRSYPASGTIVSSLDNGRKVFLDAHDVTITPGIVLRASYENRDREFIERHLQPGDWFADVGANVGVYAITAARRTGRFGRVWAFEPNPKASKLLERTVLANWMQDRISVIPDPVSDETSEVTFSYHDDHLGGGSIVGTEQRPRDLTGRKHQGKIEFRVTPIVLDTFFKESAIIRILKIDVEGFEANVLRGSRRLLEGHQVDFIIMEYHRTDYRAEDDENLAAMQELVKFGYQPGYSTPSGRFVSCRTLEQTLQSCPSQNFIFASQFALETIGYRS
jgi:FkbM family methyltransferase